MEKNELTRVNTGTELLSDAYRIGGIIERLPDDTRIIIERAPESHWRIECWSAGRQILKISTDTPWGELEYLRDLFETLKKLGEEK